jgi:hypothetical protein
MGNRSVPAGRTAPLFRPKLLIETARIGARLYRRDRDLSAAVPGLVAAAPGNIVARLSAAERRCEDMRLDRSPAYRPGRHVQILSALIAEAARGAAQAKASGSDALRSAT